MWSWSDFGQATQGQTEYLVPLKLYNFGLKCFFQNVFSWIRALAQG